MGAAVKLKSVGSPAMLYPRREGHSDASTIAAVCSNFTWETDSRHKILQGIFFLLLRLSSSVDISIDSRSQ